MNYSYDLETRLNAKRFIDKFEESFDRSKYYTNSKNPLKLLRRIKLFLYREWNNWRFFSQDSMLNSTDCLTLAVIVNLLAYRKGVETNIVRPKNVSRYLHAMLEYDTKKGKNLFKLAGRSRKYECLCMTSKQVEKRIKYIRPLVNLINSFRFSDNVLEYI
jgi:hypothetical protein